MENPLLAITNRTFICCIVFVDIVEYSKKTTAKQLAIKGWFNDIISQSVQNTSPTERIILDTGDGAALCFLGDPEEALFVANSLRVAVLESAYPEMAFRIGVNLGPVKLIKDVNGQPNIVGDGINVAQRVMSFAEPNQILVSRSYYEVVSRLAEEYAHVFQYQGMHQDKHVREHEVYEFGFLAAGTAAPPEIKSRIEAASEGASKTEMPSGSEASRPGAPPEHAQPVPFDEETLAGIAGKLSQYLGPLAKLIVRKTATKTSDVAELCKMLAASIPSEQQRTVFCSSVSEFAGTAAGAPENADPVAEPHRVETTSAVLQAPAKKDLAPDTLAFAEQLFARYIGPMAKILVRRAAKNSPNASALFQELARNIDDASQRRAFLAESEKKRSSG